MRSLDSLTTSTLWAPHILSRAAREEHPFGCVPHNNLRRFRKSY